MSKKRNATGLAGILAIDKPASLTSHDVVDAVRQISGERRVGHTGTLDPMATGLLLLGVGPATRLANYLMSDSKTYEARIIFGTATNTDDAEGEVVQTSLLPPKVGDLAFAQSYLDGLVGELEQVPPAFSAIKRDGVKAYQAARSGQALELAARSVELYDANVITCKHDFWDVSLTVSKGFYVRSLARDIGRQLGSAAHLGALRRTVCGNTSIEQAMALAQLREDAKLTSCPALPFIDPVRALGIPVAEVDTRQLQTIQNGGSLTLATQPTPTSAMRTSLVSLVNANRLLAIYEIAGRSGLARPKVVIPGGVELPSES